MAQVINTNSLSLIAQNDINENQSALSSSIERLSSGSHINSVKDDAAGQVIASRFTSNIKGLIQAAHNANDGISVAQTIEGMSSKINNDLQRVCELTIQVFTGTNSDSDLDSIQNEIKSRLNEIDRVSGQTRFNGVNILARDNSMKIQVGANDGQIITIDLKKVDSDTLGPNGSNVNGSGTIANKAVAINDPTAMEMDAATNTITTANNAPTTSKALDQLKDGNIVTIKVDTAQTTAAYTYNASVGNFSFNNVSNNTSAKAGSVAADLLPPTRQTASGVYETASGEVNFDVDADGKITIGEREAYLTSDDNLTTNDTGGATAAMLDGLFKKAGDGQSIGFSKAASVTMGGTTYNFRTGADAGAVTANAGILSTDTASKETVLNKTAATKQGIAVVANDDTSATITHKSGVQTYQTIFAIGDDIVSAKYADNTDVSNTTATCTDADGEMTIIGSYTTKYSIDANNGKVTVDSGAGMDKYVPKVGAGVYVSISDTLATDAASKSVVTKDPLRAPDEAISSIDKSRLSLGAIQDRLDSAVANLNNTTTNLLEVQSRIQDTDYATEVSNMSRAQIIQQADNSVLTEADQVPQQILSLLQGQSP